MGCSHSRPSRITLQLFASFRLGFTISFQSVYFYFTHFYRAEVTLTLPTPLFNLLSFPDFFLSKTWIMPLYYVCFEISIPVLENVSVVCVAMLFSSSSLPQMASPWREGGPGKWLLTPQLLLDLRARRNDQSLFSFCFFLTFPLMENIVFLYPDLLCNALFYPSEWIVVHRVHRASSHTHAHIQPRNKPSHTHCEVLNYPLGSSPHCFSSKLLAWSSAGLSPWVFLSPVTCTVLGFVLLYLSLYLILTQSWWNFSAFLLPMG